MKTLKNINLAYLFRVGMTLVLLGGVAVIHTINSVSNDVAEKTNLLIDDRFPQLEAIYELHGTVKELELSLYHYYETEEEDVYKEAWEDYTRYTEILLSIVDDDLIDKTKANFYLLDLKKKAALFDREMRMGDKDWTILRSHLTDFNEVNDKFNELSYAAIKDLHLELKGQKKRTQEAIIKMSMWQIGFSLLVFVVAIIVAVSFRRQLELTQKQKELSLFPEQNPNPVLEIDKAFNVTYLNPAAKALFETEKELGCAEELLPLLSEVDYKKLFEGTLSIVDCLHKVGKRTFSISFHHVKGFKTAHVYILDVTDKVESQIKLDFQANYDVATKLPNRQSLERYVSSKTLSGNEGFTLLMIRADRLPLINESLGYEVSDRILVEMSERFESFVQFNKGVTIRIFSFTRGNWVLVASDASEGFDVASFSQELVALFNTAIDLDGGAYSMPVEVGVTSYPECGLSAKDLIRNADAALREVHSEGGSIKVYEKSLTEKAMYKLTMEHALKSALENNELTLNIQPKVDADSGVMHGGEVLLRWNNDGKWISPAEFIPVAEESGIILEIGEWVLRESCLQWMSWTDLDLKPGRIAVNISAQQFTQIDFVDTVAAILAETGMMPECLELEITEEVASNNPEKVIKTMTDIKALGVRIAMDDFGTGYSSLSYLKRFPIDTLKIDQSFIFKMEENESDAAIVRMISSLAKELKLEVVAEGVETKSHYETLKIEGIDLIQGYYFFRPMPIDSYTSLLKA